MAIESIGRIDTGASAVQQQSSLKLEDFLNIFLTQLSFQDPLEPVDNREFLAQLAQFSALELSNRSNENTEGLLEVSSFTQSVGLLGKTIEASGENGSIQGEVLAMRLVSGSPELTIKKADGTFAFISPSQITLIADLTGATP